MASAGCCWQPGHQPEPGDGQPDGQSYTCPLGAATDTIETYASGTTSLQNLGNGYYQLNWKTDKTYANSCRKLTLKIGDWSSDGFTALFQFKK